MKQSLYQQQQTKVVQTVLNTGHMQCTLTETGYRNVPQRKIKKKHVLYRIAKWGKHIAHRYKGCIEKQWDGKCKIFHETARKSSS